MTHITKWTWPISWMLFVFATILNPVTQAEFSPYGSPISLDEVTELHFHKGRDTTYNRNPPLPQLTCTRGCEFQPEPPSTIQNIRASIDHADCCRGRLKVHLCGKWRLYVDPDPLPYYVVVCKNIKPKGRRSRWRCETDLPSHLKIDETAIICEGFHSDEDEEVLERSCALEFTLTHAGWAPFGHNEKMAFDPKMKGWSASWIVMTAVLGYLSFHIYHGVNWIQEFKNLLQRLRMAWIKAKRWIRGMQDEMLPINPEEKSCCRFNSRRKRDRNGVTHDGPHCPDHCPDMPGH